MQAELLDSTVSEVLQPSPPVEYVSPEERPIAFPTETVIKGSLITEKQYRMHVANLFGFEAKVIVTNPKDIKDPRSTWWCLADAGIAIGSSRSGSLLGLLHRRERDSRIFTNAEIIFDDFRSKDTLLLNNRGQTFVSLSGFLEILSKTELSSDKIDDFQEEIFGRVLPQLAFEGKAEVSDEYKEKIGMPQTQAQHQFAVPKTLPEALRAYADEVERREAAERRALTAESERDEAIRTKAMIGSSREATAMNTASQKSKECEKLREQIGDSKTYKAAKSIPWLSEYFNTRNRGLYNSLAAKLKKIEAGMISEFAHIMIDDSQYGQIKAYHVAVIEKLHEMVQADEEFMKDYRKDVSPKTKNV